MAFERVTRRQAKLRMALTGVSGAGKTLTALYIGYGITGDWGKVALIDTEHERARLYANRDDLPTPVGEFLYCAMTPPFSPEKYKKMVAEGAQAVGPGGVVIVDSLSHAWMAEGGVLDIKEQIAGQKGKNSYTAWFEAGREQTSLVNAILAADCHTIVTMRSKMEYALEVNERGKQTPVKLGLAPVQRDDTEYEFDIVLDIARSHVATASKDVTFLDKYGEVVTPELGRQIAAWLGQGEAPSRAPHAPICAACGQVIAGNGVKTAEQVVAGTMAFADSPMCLPCFVKWNRDRQDAATDMAVCAGMDAGQFSQCLADWKQSGLLKQDTVAAMNGADYSVLLELLSSFGQE